MTVGDGTEHFVKDGQSAMRETHCVLWHAQDWPPSQELRTALDRRGMTVYRHDERPAVLADVCRLRGTRQGLGGRPAIIVFVEPDHLLRPDEMKEVIDRYAPTTACWQYRATGNPQLRAVTDQDVQRWRAERPTVQPRVAASIKSPNIWAEARSRRGATNPPMPPMPVSSMSAPMIVGPRLKLTGSTPNTIQLNEPKAGGTVEPKPPARMTPPMPITPIGPARPVGPGAAGPARPASSVPAPTPVRRSEGSPVDPKQGLTQEELAMLLAGEEGR